MPEHQQSDKGRCKAVMSRKDLKERFQKRSVLVQEGVPIDNTLWEPVHRSNLSETEWMENLEMEAVKGDGQMLHHLGGSCMVEA